MIAPKPTASQGPVPADTQVTTGNIDSPDGPLTNLRGAGVDVDVRRVGQVVIGICLVGVAVLAVIQLVAGFQKNAQINSLRNNGVPVQIRVSGCLGLLGGSGSNAAGYDCRGTFTLDGRTYTENLPGNSLLTPGTTLPGVSVPGDPALVSTPSIVADQHPSWTVFTVPVILLVFLPAILVVLFVRRRGVRAARRTDHIRTGSPSPAIDHRS
jgi:hypothetical protein